MNESLLKQIFNHYKITDRNNVEKVTSERINLIYYDLEKIITNIIPNIKINIEEKRDYDYNEFVNKINDIVAPYIKEEVSSETTKERFDSILTTFTERMEMEVEEGHEKKKNAIQKVNDYFFSINSITMAADVNLFIY
ncbi:hypothetical protein AH06_00435 [candidate division TM6 bacterium Zodletone_IIa]|nr:hypothetical protein AH06_00435 [candidate division TM6 bacterium Zodletone_IIa]